MLQNHVCLHLYIGIRFILTIKVISNAFVAAFVFFSLTVRSEQTVKILPSQ